MRTNHPGFSSLHGVILRPVPLSSSEGLTGRSPRGTRLLTHSLVLPSLPPRASWDHPSNRVPVPKAFAQHLLLGTQIKILPLGAWIYSTRPRPILLKLKATCPATLGQSLPVGGLDFHPGSEITLR